jgi:hypothetical protein
MAKTKFYRRQVDTAIEKATRETIEAAAFRIRENAGANVVANDQIDTGAMVNAFYVVLPGGDDYSDATGEASSRNPAAEVGPRAGLDGGADAVVANAMEYAIDNELRQSFLFKAAEQAAAEFDGLAEKKF